MSLPPLKGVGFSPGRNAGGGLKRRRIETESDVEVPSFSLLGQKAFVTGSSRGIGRAVAPAPASAGADVAISCNTGGAAAEIWKAIDKEYDHFFPSKVRVEFDKLNRPGQTPRQLARAVEAILRACGN